MEVDNGAFGRNAIWVEHKNAIYVQGADGHRYHAELGFLSHPDALSTIQQYWSLAGRGGANWRMRIVVRAQVGWVACTPEMNACYDNVEQNNTQAELKIEVYLKDHVWQSLLNDYLASGWQGYVQNAYYPDVQRVIFEPMSGQVPDSPCLGFRFTRVD
ncbi:hypothetical protein J7L13_02470 [bacterium]|nr:hypothetical protein [bacterium]